MSKEASEPQAERPAAIKAKRENRKGRMWLSVPVRADLGPVAAKKGGRARKTKAPNRSETDLVNDFRMLGFYGATPIYRSENTHLNPLTERAQSRNARAQPLTKSP